MIRMDGEEVCGFSEGRLEANCLRASQGKGKGFVYCCVFVFLKGKELKLKEV